MSKKGTLLVHILSGKLVKLRVDSVDNHVDIEQHFYSQRILNKFKVLLKKSNVDFYTHFNGTVVIIEPLVVWTTGKGRFGAKNKTCLNGYEFEFSAQSTLELIVKLMRFRIINLHLVYDLCKTDGIELPKISKKRKLITPE